MRKILIFLSIFFLLHMPSYSENHAQKIISLGPAVTDALRLLGVDDRIIANTIYCRTPQGSQEKEKIGTVLKINLERIVELRPDLVLATSLTDRKQIQKMKDLKINVVEVPSAQNFEQICRNFLQLGELVGKRPESEKIIDEARNKVDFVRMITKDIPKQKVLAQIGTKPLFVATKEYFINDFIELAGGINITSDSKSGRYSREEALKQNPDVIIISTMGIIGEAEKKIWQKYKSINAVKKNKIYIIDSDKLCAPTPASFIETLKEITQILHPQIKPQDLSGK